MKKFDHILLFKTNCSTGADKLMLQCLMQQDGIEEWNLDLDDCDYVLRVISRTLNHASIILLLNRHGYECCELI
ncbi:hypothetical protein KXD93_21510 [Mucilaginibacter sp. BJC16-A38]|uniref:hypothetical protein n=1 Tax=Mucilaginibacter phenanthrenivorans TaxID=1234842 RepID=UPI00215773B5|nr:hypothetical protein [Mucilaginibacter phenanthrenivorans]MCR8560244.1 hypothetical protein [Mucilaginibacter phenanthrenivorans]